MAYRFLVLASLASSLKNFRGHLVQAVVQRGYEVHAVAPGLTKDVETREWLEHNALECHDLAMSRTGLSPVNDTYTLWALVRLMRQIRPKHFLGYTIKPVIWGLIAAKIAGVPTRAALITGLGYAFTGEASGKRAVIQFIVKRLYKFALQRATIIFFQNPDDQADFLNHGLLPQGVPVKVVNGSGVDIESFSILPLPEQPFCFLLIARLLGDKGIREYVAAARKVKALYPTVEFHLVGGLDPNPDGISEEEVLSWQDAGKITWHGALTDVRPAIANAHAYVLPSYREGTPRTVLEAMAMGRPIITTDAPGCRETVIDGENGFLVPVQSVEELAAAMVRFVEDPELAPRMGKRSREIAEEKYDVHKVNEFMLKEMGIE